MRSDSLGAAALAIADVASLKRDLLQEAEQSSSPIDARSILRDYPELWHEKSFVVELAYEEFIQRQELGLNVDPEAFCDQFPRFRTTLHRVLALHQMVEHNPTLFEHGHPPWPSIGDTWLGYRLLEELGVGSFSRVYLALEENVGQRKVALKVSLEGADEAHCLGRLEHPNIVPILGINQDPASGWTAIAMPYRGRFTLEDLKDGVIHVSQNGQLTPGMVRPDLAQQQPTCPAAVLRIGAAIAEALQHSHDRNIVHGDLKPSNVLLSDEGKVFLLDFNLAKAATNRAFRRGGTLPYMSSEQLECIVAGSSETAQSPQSDLFALGIILHELLTGRHPYAQDFLSLSNAPLPILAQNLLDRQHASLPQLRYSILEPSAARLLRSCLAIDPSHRPATAGVVAAGLRTSATWPHALQRWAQSNPRQVAAGVLISASLLAGTSLWLSNRPSISEQHLQQGLIALREGRAVDAVNPLHKSLLADPGSIRVRLALAYAYQERGEYFLALAQYEELGKLTEDPRAVAGVAYCEALLGHQAVAIAAAQKALEHGFRTPELLNNLAFSYTRRSDFDSAERLFTEALSLRQDSSILLINRAMTRWQRAYDLGSPIPSAALDDLQSALTLADTNPLPYVLAARILANNKTPDADDRTIEYLVTAAKLGWDYRSVVSDGFLARFAEHSSLANLPSNEGPIRHLDESSRWLPPFSANDL